MEETTEDFDDSDEEPIQFQVFTQTKTKTKAKTKGINGNETKIQYDLQTLRHIFSVETKRTK